MNNFQFPYGQSTQPPYSNTRQIQEMFPQPQGSVYQINSPMEVGNVPIGSTGLSVAICFQDEVMYIKSFQNGVPIIMPYRVVPYNKEETPSPPKEVQTNTTEERLNKIEKILLNLTNEGGKFDGLL